MLLAIFLLLGGLFVSQAEAIPHPPAPLPPSHPVSATPNPWFWLHRYDGTMTKKEFSEILKKIFDPFGGLKSYVEYTDNELRIYSSPNDHWTPQFVLPLATESTNTPSPLIYRTPEVFQAIQKTADHPLLGLRVAIDPGHIGGKWGDIENRSTMYHDLGKIQEGDMNIITARILEKNLQALGAEVFLSRRDTEPVTTFRPPDLLDEAREYFLQKRPDLADKPIPEQIRSLGAERIRLRSEYLFFRKYEFMARAEKIRKFHPDITVVLYINATPSSAWAHLIGVDQNIFFIHGAYTREEAQDPTQQIRLIYKILDRVTPVEYEVATAIARSFTQITGIKPVPYMDSSTTRAISEDNAYVVARNLGANRYYDGPVVTTEPYFMNNRTIARRLLAGDYDGQRVIDGKLVGSLFREYAECVTQGLLAAYGPKTPSPIPPNDMNGLLKTH